MLVRRRGWYNKQAAPHTNIYPHTQRVLRSFAVRPTNGLFIRVINRTHRSQVMRNLNGRALSLEGQWHRWPPVNMYATLLMVTPCVRRAQYKWHKDFSWPAPDRGRTSFNAIRVLTFWFWYKLPPRHNTQTPPPPIYPPMCLSLLSYLPFYLSISIYPPTIASTPQPSLSGFNAHLGVHTHWRLATCLMIRPSDSAIIPTQTLALPLSHARRRRRGSLI